MTHATMPCDGGCAGTGRINREVRTMENGEPDLLDFRHEELCPKCGGSGVIINWGGKPIPVIDRKPGYVCDQIHGSFKDVFK